MRQIFFMIIAGLCTMLPSCRMGFADEAGAPVWTSPLVQQLRVPAGIREGVYYPAHDELVMVKPGAWQFMQASAAGGPAVPVPGSDSRSLLPVTLVGRMSLTKALAILAEVMCRQLSVGAGVEDRDVSVDIKGSSAEEALRTLLYPSGYGFKMTDERLLIMARDTRVFRLNLPPLTQAFDTATTNESSSVSFSGSRASARSADSRVRVGAKILVENTSGVLSYWQDIEANVKGLVSSSGVVTVNKAAGVVVVTDSPRELERIAVFFDDINARASQQILVDVKVVEVELSREHKLGIDWGAIASRGDLKGLGFTTNFASGNISSGNMMTFSARADKEGSGDSESGVKAVIKALGSFGRIEVVSQPRVMMLNNSVASIQVGETKSYVESTNMETTQGGGMISSASLSEVHGGVTLQIVGSIVGDDVFLNVTPVVSTIDDIRSIALSGGNRLEAPDTSIKTLSTLVRVRTGKTVAIGGLITHDRSKQQYGIPLLSRVPFLGKLFSYEARRNARKELVVFITPGRG